MGILLWASTTLSPQQYPYPNSNSERYIMAGRSPIFVDRQIMLSCIQCEAIYKV